MSLGQHCSELHKISTLVNAEVCMLCCMRSQGEAAQPEVEARTLAAGIAQWALLRPVLICEAITMEMEAAWVT